MDEYMNVCMYDYITNKIRYSRAEESTKTIFGQLVHSATSIHESVYPSLING